MKMQSFENIRSNKQNAKEKCWAEEKERLKLFCGEDPRKRAYGSFLGHLITFSKLHFLGSGANIKCVVHLFQTVGPSLLKATKMVHLKQR